MKKLLFLFAALLLCFAVSAQSYKYLPTKKTGSVFYQYDTIVTPVGADTVFSFEAYLVNPSTLIIDCRALDDNDSQIDIGTRGLDMDTVFLSLGWYVLPDGTMGSFPLTIDTVAFPDKTVIFRILDAFAPELLVKYTRGSASDSLKLPVQLFTPR